MSDSLFRILESDDLGNVIILEEYDVSDGESEIENVSSDDEKWFVNENGNLVSEELYSNGFLERKIHLPTGDGYFQESSKEYIDYIKSDSLFRILESDDLGNVIVLEEYDVSDGESEIENVSGDDEKWFVNENGNLVSEELYPNGFLERKIHLPTGDGYFQESSEEYIDPSGNVVFQEEEAYDNLILGSGKKIRGTAEDDYILGKGKSKKIFGFSGDDVIDPGKVKNGSNYVKCKGGSGADTFVIDDQYRLFIKDFNVIEDELKISGLNGNFDYDIKRKKTFIFDDDGDVVAKIKGVFDLSEANII